MCELLVLSQMGKIYLQYYGPRAQVVILEPQLIKEVLNDKDKAYFKADLDALSKKIVEDGLVLSKGEKWVKMRKLANFAFHGGSLKVSSWCFS